LESPKALLDAAFGLLLPGLGKLPVGQIFRNFGSSTNI
jgi:hypothetical protein